MLRSRTFRHFLLIGAVLGTGMACSGSSGGSGPGPTAPVSPGNARIVALDDVAPRGPQTLNSMPESTADLVSLAFIVECEPPGSGEPCHLGFDFLDVDGNLVPRGPGSGEFVGVGTHTMQAAGAPKGFTGDTVGIRAFVTVGTTAVELASSEFRRDSLSFTWVGQ